MTVFEKLKTINTLNAIKYLTIVMYVCGLIGQFFYYYRTLFIFITAIALILHIMWINKRFSLLQKISINIKIFTLLFILPSIWFLYANIEASKIVYQIVKANPEHFTLAIQGFSFFVTIQLIFLFFQKIMEILTPFLGSLLLIIFDILIIVYLFALAIKSKVVIITINLLAFGFGIDSVNSMIFNIIQKNTYNEFNQIAQRLVVWSSYYDNLKIDKDAKICNNKQIPENAKIAFLDDGYISVAIQDSNSSTFKMSKIFYEIDRIKWIKPEYEFKTLKCNE